LRKLIVSALVATSLFGGVGVARADKPSDPGQQFGQCTAYFNGQKNGHPADTMDDVQAMYDGCKDVGIGGNPDHGRYPECFTDDGNPLTKTCSDG
jgi:hypothetical protein